MPRQSLPGPPCRPPQSMFLNSRYGLWFARACASPAAARAHMRACFRSRYSCMNSLFGGDSHAKPGL